MRTQLELPNDVAAELAGPGDVVMRTLEEPPRLRRVPARQRAHARRRRGRRRDGPHRGPRAVATCRQGHEIAPGTIEAIAGALDRARVARAASSRTWSGATAGSRSRPRPSTRSATSTRSAAQTITVGIGRRARASRSSPSRWRSPRSQRREVNRIVLTRPAVEAGERLGFLPGDMMAKVDPYLRPLFDALYDMLEPERVNQHLERGVIEVAPLAFMRGRTLNDSFIILDEAQNTTPGADEDVPDAARVQLEDGRHRRRDPDRPAARAGAPGCVVIGDILKDVEGIEFVRFGGEDVVRHKLVQRIVAAYDEYAEKQAPALRAPRRQQHALIELELHRRARASCAGAGARARSRRPGVRGRAPRDRARRRRSASASSTASTAARDQPTDVLSFPVDDDRPGARAARAGRRRDLPRAHRGPERGRGPRRAAPVRLRPRGRRRRDARAAGRESWSGCEHALRLRRARRPAERRQVDAGQPDRRRQGRDHLGQAADHAPGDPRHRDGRGLAARARRPAGRAAAARPADRAHAAPRRARARRRRRGAVRPQRRAAVGPGRPLHRRGDPQRRGAGRDRAEQGRPARPRRAPSPRSTPPPSSTCRARSSRSARAAARASTRWSSSSSSLLPEGAVPLPARGAQRPVGRGARRRAGPRAGAAAHARGAAARGRGRGGRDRGARGRPARGPRAACGRRASRRRGSWWARAGGWSRRSARRRGSEIEELLGRRVHLDLRVRVRKGWRRDEALLDRLGIE